MVAKKKILIFSLAYYPKHIGGAEVAIKEITDRLPGEQYEFHVLCNRYDNTLPHEDKIGNVFVHRIGYATKNPSMGDLSKLPLHICKITYQWQAYYVAKKLHKKYKFDAVWAMMAHSCGIPAAKFKRKYPSVPYVLTLQEGDPPAYIEHKMRFFGKLFNRAFTEADVVQSISSFLQNWSLRMGAVGKQVLIPNAVDTKKFITDYSTKERQALRAELSLSEADVALVTTSRLVHKNATDDVIRALVHLPEKVKFVVFGVGPDENLLKKLISELGLEKRVQLRGQIGHDVMPRYLKACDIFIRPSRSEGMGNSFVEAMAAGLPVIATQEGGIADFLFDETRNSEQATTGWAVDPNSPQQIADAVMDIIERPEKVREVTQRAREMAVAKYDWELVAAQMKDKVFETLFK